MADNARPIRFYVALRGDKPPRAYAEIAQLIEELGYDRIYVYDDLMYYSASQILTLIAAHTHTIEIGPCLVNGFYRHPAIIAQEAAFLETLAPGRTVLGVGRGAFFDFYNLRDDEPHTRRGVEETIGQVRRLLSGDRSVLAGELFAASEKAFLRVPLPPREIPIVVGSWNRQLARVAGERAAELQVANVWSAEYLAELAGAMRGAAATAGATVKLNVGGMTCVSSDRDAASRVARSTIAVYVPYLTRLLARQGFDTGDDYFQEVFRLSRAGEYDRCAALLTNEVVEKIALVGTAESVVDRIRRLHDAVGFDAVMLSPPYGTGTLEESLEFARNQIIAPLRS